MTRQSVTPLPQRTQSLAFMKEHQPYRTGTTLFRLLYLTKARAREAT